MNALRTVVVVACLTTLCGAHAMSINDMRKSALLADALVIPVTEDAAIIISFYGRLLGVEANGVGGFLYDVLGRPERIGKTTLRYGVDGTLEFVGDKRVLYDELGRVEKIDQLKMRFDVAGRMDNIGKTVIRYRVEGGLEDIQGEPLPGLRLRFSAPKP
ncbi:MAG: hypothetical protein HS116_19400 [Planctomycetes bacterium]|nr:hypothetical protein [Planctomycetota bacterium]